MKKQLFLVSLLAFLVFSCKKTNNGDGNALNGKWEITQVVLRSTGESFQPALPLENAPFIHFDNGAFTGRTDRNSISGEYTLGGIDSLRILSFTRSEVNENDFGKAVMNLMISCQLSSLYPCPPSLVLWESGDRIKITTLWYILHLQRQ
ncbi:MAG: hypothetical protein EOO09_05790 [Chitinophagaceae bacterium]|nr:MAG: hypothetical protein EOO09_05790 [Chitinophagaceae bacterium]